MDDFFTFFQWTLNVQYTEKNTFIPTSDGWDVFFRKSLGILVLLKGFSKRAGSDVCLNLFES